MILLGNLKISYDKKIVREGDDGGMGKMDEGK